MKLIVGLGNPGDKYENNRHNIGFRILEQYVSVNNLCDFSYNNKIAGEIFSVILEGEKISFLKPMEYMNLSGQAVKRFADFYKIQAKDILVIHDEIDLITGIVKIKFGGGLAGHNGLKSIAEKIGSRDFWRIRVGVDRPSHSSQSVADYVLENFKKEEIDKIQDQYLDIEKFILDFIKN